MKLGDADAEGADHFPTCIHVSGNASVVVWLQPWSLCLPGLKDLAWEIAPSSLHFREWLMEGFAERFVCTSEMSSLRGTQFCKKGGAG